MRATPDESLALVLPERAAERIAERAAAIVLERLADAGASDSPYFTVVEAAEYLRAKPQRVYDLLSARRLTRYKDGRRTLISRAELDAYVAGERPSAVAPTLPLPLRARTRTGLAA